MSPTTSTTMAPSSATAEQQRGRRAGLPCGELNGAVDLGSLSGGHGRPQPRSMIQGSHPLGHTGAARREPCGVLERGSRGSPGDRIWAHSGEAESWAYGLNDLGFVVGSADEPNGTYHAFVWDGTEMIDLGTLGGYFSSAYGINDQGSIVGFAMDASGQTHAVEWVLVPEPSAPFLGLLGGSIVLLWASRRRPPSVARR